MRLDGRETVEVSKPEVPLAESERRPVYYDAASADGSEVVFNTGTPLLAGETTNGNKLFIYNTETHDLRFVASGVPQTFGTGGDKVLVSEDGSAVYYEASGSIYRYETLTGITSFVAANVLPGTAGEASYTTPDGQFLMFVSGGPGCRGRRPRWAGARTAGRHGSQRAVPV